MSYPITPDPSIHQLPASIAAQQQQQNSVEIEATANRLLQAILNALLALLTGGVLGTGSTSSANSVTFFVNLFSNFFKLLGIGDPGNVLGKIASDIFDPVAVIQDFINFIIGPTGLVSLSADTQVLVDDVQKVIDALVSGVTKTASVGNDALSAALALANETLALPGQVLNDINSLLAALLGSVTAIQNNPGGASQTDDFANVTLSGWTSILGTLSLSNGFIRTSSIAAGYIGTPSTARTPNTDRHGIQFVIDGKMRGGTTAWICGDATMSNYAALEVYSGFDGDAARIVTGAGSSLTVVQAQVDFIDAPSVGPTTAVSTSGRVLQTTTFDLRYNPGNNTFTVLRNNVAVLTWTDSTNIVTHGSSKRFVGVVSDTYNDSSDTGFGIKKVTFYDF